MLYLVHVHSFTISLHVGLSLSMPLTQWYHILLRFLPNVERLKKKQVKADIGAIKKGEVEIWKLNAATKTRRGSVPCSSLSTWGGGRGRESEVIPSRGGACYIFLAVNRVIIIVAFKNLFTLWGFCFAFCLVTLLVTPQEQPTPPLGQNLMRENLCIIYKFVCRQTCRHVKPTFHFS